MPLLIISVKVGYSCSLLFNTMSVIPVHVNYSCYWFVFHVCISYRISTCVCYSFPIVIPVTSMFVIYFLFYPFTQLKALAIVNSFIWWSCLFLQENQICVFVHWPSSQLIPSTCWIICSLCVLYIGNNYLKPPHWIPVCHDRIVFFIDEGDETVVLQHTRRTTVPAGEPAGKVSVYNVC